MKKSTAELRTELADLGVELTEHKHEEEHHVITALLLNAHQTKMDAEKEKRDARKLALKKERDLIKNMSLTAAKKVSLTETDPNSNPQTQPLKPTLALPQPKPKPKPKPEPEPKPETKPETNPRPGR